MNPAAIVKDLDVVEELILRFLSGCKALVVNHLTFQVTEDQVTEETFAHRIISTVTFTTHTLLAVHAASRSLKAELAY